MGRRERRRERIPSRFRVVNTEPHVGLDLMNGEIMTSAEIKSGTLNCMSHPGAPSRPLHSKGRTFLPCYLISIHNSPPWPVYGPYFEKWREGSLFKK